MLQTPPYFDTKSLILYVIVGLCLTFFISLYLKSNKKNPLLLWSAFMMLVVFAVSRKVSYGLGGIDAIEYEQIFLRRDFSRLEGNNEFLFVWFTGLIRNFTDSPVFYRFCCYSFIAFSYIFFIKEFCPLKASAIPYLLVVYPYLLSFNTMRNSMAVSLILMGLVLLQRERRIFSLLMAISAVLVHRMSIIYVPFFLLYNRIKNIYVFNNKKVVILIVVIAMALSIVIGETLQQYIMGTGVLEGADAYYIGANRGKSFFNATAMFLPLCLLMFGWLIVGNKEIAEKSRILYLVMIYDIVIFPCTFIFGMWRANEYAYIPRLTMWAILLYSFCQKFTFTNRRFIKMVFLLAFVVWLISRIEGAYMDAGLMPYILDWY